MFMVNDEVGNAVKFRAIITENIQYQNIICSILYFKIESYLL